MNPLEKIIAGGSTLQGKPLHGGAANHLNTPTSGGSSCEKTTIGGKKPHTSGGSSCEKTTIGGKKPHTSGGSSSKKTTIGGKKRRSTGKRKKKGGNGFLSHITIPALFVAANTTFGKKKKINSKKRRSPFTKKNRK